MVIWIPLLANSLAHHGDTEYTEVHRVIFLREPLCPPILRGGFFFKKSK